MSKFPLSDIKFHNIPVVGQFYTKTEVDVLIKDAVDEARRIDEDSMRKHNRDATVISMILGFTTLALFVDGLLLFCIWLRLVRFGGAWLVLTAF